MKSRKYGIIHAYAQCRNFDWDAALDINSTSRMSKLRAQIKRHVEKEGHTVGLETGNSTEYRP